MSPTCPFGRMVCTCLLLVLFGGWSTQVFTHVSHVSFSADGVHRPLHVSPTGPFGRMVCTGCYTCLLLVLFGGWSAGALTHVSNLSFSADGPHRRYTCLPRVLFGGWSAQAPTCLLPVLLANGLHRRLHILADGLHRPLHVFYVSFWRMVCTGHYTNGVDPAPCTLHCLRPDSIPYTLGCLCETSTLKLFKLICGPCHQKGERLHTGSGQEHNSYPCQPLP